MTKKEYTSNCTVKCSGLAVAIKKHLETDENIVPKLTEELLKTCEAFVTDCARKVLKSSNGAVEDAIVYKWARDYFNDGLYLEDVGNSDNLDDTIPEASPEVESSGTTEPAEVAENATTEPAKEAAAEPAKTKQEYIAEQMDLFG